MTFCPKCGDVVTRELPMSTACWACYRAAVYGGTRAEWRERDRLEAEALQAEVSAIPLKP